MPARLNSRVASVHSSYLRDIARVLSGNSLAQAIALVSLPLLTRLFSPHDFAMQNLFVQFTGFASVLLTWRYEYLIALPETDERARALERLVFLLACLGTVVGTVLVVLFRDGLASLVGEPDLARYLPMAVGTAALLCVGMACQNTAQRHQRYHLSSLSEVLGKSGYVLVAFVVGWIDSGPTGLLCATAGGALLKITTLWSHRQPETSVPKLPAKALLSAASHYRKMAASISLSHVLMTLTGAIPSIFVARAYGNESLGQFALVLMTLFLPSALLGNSLGQVYFQRAAAEWAKSSNFQRLWASTARWLLLGGLPIYVLVFLLAATIYPFAFGTRWTAAGTYAALLVPAAFFSFLTSPLDRGCLVVGAWKYVLGWHCLRVVSTGLLALLADSRGWSIEDYLQGLNAQMTLCYLIDFCAGRSFASRTPPGAKAQAGSAQAAPGTN